DAETVRQRRSHLESILNVAQRLRLRCFHRLRPCWTACLSILYEGPIVVPHVRAMGVLTCQRSVSAAASVFLRRPSPRSISASLSPTWASGLSRLPLCTP